MEYGFSCVAVVSALKKTLYGLEQKRPDVALRRARWYKIIPKLDPRRMVFIDETWIKTNMAPLRGWGLRGKRVIGHAPYGHWRTMTFVAALSIDNLQAPCVFDGPINAASFKAWVDQCLVPTLRPGQIVIMDNLGSHKSLAVKQAIHATGARLWFLPPYSPDLNPIEQTFAKIKHWMRMAGQRSIDNVQNELGNLIKTITPHECSNYIHAVGYGSAKT
jgi:transposase